MCAYCARFARAATKAGGAERINPHTHKHTHLNICIYICVCVRVCVSGDGNRKPAKLALSDCKDFSAELEGIACVGGGTVAGARARAVLAVRGSSPLAQVVCERDSRGKSSAAANRQQANSICISQFVYLQFCICSGSLSRCDCVCVYVRCVCVCVHNECEDVHALLSCAGSSPKAQ